MNTIVNIDTKKFIGIIGGLIVLALLAAGFYFSRSGIKKPEIKGAVGAAGEVSKRVPAIVTNPAEKVPEVNPVDRANPFKYSNPLR